MYKSQNSTRCIIEGQDAVLRKIEADMYAYCSEEGFDFQISRIDNHTLSIEDNSNLGYGLIFLNAEKDYPEVKCYSISGTPLRNQGTYIHDPEKKHFNYRWILCKGGVRKYKGTGRIKNEDMFQMSFLLPEEILAFLDEACPSDMQQEKDEPAEHFMKRRLLHTGINLYEVTYI